MNNHRIATTALLWTIFGVALLFGAVEARAAGFKVETASCQSPEVQRFMMDTLPTLYSQTNGMQFAADHTVERIIFATDAPRFYDNRLVCRLTVRLRYKGTVLPTKGNFIMDQYPNGKIRTTWMSTK